MRKLRIHRVIATVVLVLGLGMMVGMIVFEDEPGGIPVLLVLIGAAWLFRTQRRLRQRPS
ncbi:MAG: hypothetical protein AAGJ10_19155 [Bacteroidota bacterium]